MQIQMQSQFFRYTDIKKVRLSMARLLTVVNERKKIRTLYRQQLEDEYIAKKKQEELDAFLFKREKSQKTKSIKDIKEMTEDELKQHLQQKDDFKANQMKRAREKIMHQIEKSEKRDGSQTAPLINQQDIDFIASTKVRLGQKDLLRMYVGNWADLNLKQRRKVFGYIQAQRAKHAKQIFIKELSAIGRKLDRQTTPSIGGNQAALVDGSKLKGRKDPIKLKLESVTA